MAGAVVPFKFDVPKARTDGYSDDEILDHLGTTKNFDVKKALADGYSRQELIDHLSGPAGSPYAKPGPYNTQLPPDKEAAFQKWVKEGKIPWQDSSNNDYDMRGFYNDTAAMKERDARVAQGGSRHFPDTYKTPYHQSFSNESHYATPDAPHWTNDTDLVDKNGKLVFSERSDAKTRPLGVSMMGSSNAAPIPDNIINFLRPIVAGAGAAGGAALAGPVGGITGYTGLDALLQHLQTKPPRSMTGDALDLKPGGIASTLTNTGEQYATGKLFEAAGKVVKGGISAFRDANRPEIYYLQPTTSQALKSEGLTKLAAAAKAFEDINKNAKNAALDRTAGRGFTEALETARNADLTLPFNRDPNAMLDLVNQDMPLGPGSMTPVKFTQNEAPFTPIKVTEQPRQVTPITIQDKPITPRNPVSGQKDVIPGEVKDLKAPSGRYDVTAGPQKSATIPGSYTTQAGTPKLNLTDSFAKLDAVIRDPKKLQETLARAQELGTGDNLKKSLGGYQFMKLFNEATTRDISKNSGFAGGNVTRINSDALSRAFLDPEMQSSFKLLYSNQQRSDIAQFFKNLAATQDKINVSQFGRYGRPLTLVGGGIILSHAITSGSLAGVAGLGATTGMYLGAQQLGRLLTNPKTARLMVALANGEGLGVSDTYASKMIAQALNGGLVALVNADGKQIPGRVQDGQFKPE